MTVKLRQKKYQIVKTWNNQIFQQKRVVRKQEGKKLDQLDETLDSGFKRLNATLENASESINEKIGNKENLRVLLYENKQNRNQEEIKEQTKMPKQIINTEFMNEFSRTLEGMTMDDWRKFNEDLRQMEENKTYVYAFLKEDSEKTIEVCIENNNKTKETLNKNREPVNQKIENSSKEIENKEDKGTLLSENKNNSNKKNTKHPEKKTKKTGKICKKELIKHGNIWR